LSAQEPVKSYLPGIDPAEFAVFLGLLRLHTTLVRGLDAELQTANGLSVSAFEVMNWLAYAPGRQMRMSAIASSVLLSLSGITRLVERLEREGLVRREPCPDDRRGSLATLTEAGLDRLREARLTHAAGVRRRLLDLLTPAEVEALGALWRRLLEAQPSDSGSSGR